MQFVGGNYVKLEVKGLNLASDRLGSRQLPALYLFSTLVVSTNREFMDVSIVGTDVVRYKLPPFLSPRHYDLTGSYIVFAILLFWLFI